MDGSNPTPVEKFIKCFDIAHGRQILHEDQVSSQVMGYLLEISAAFDSGDFSLFVDHSEKIQIDFVERVRSYLTTLRVLSGENVTDGLTKRFLEAMEVLQFFGKSELVRSILRDTHGMLLFLTKNLDAELPPRDRLAILKAIETFTRSIVVVFKPPHFAVLIKKIIQCYLKEDDNSVETLDLPIKILLNLCGENVCCVLMVKEDDQCKHLMRAFTSLIESKDDNGDKTRKSRVHAAFTQLQFVLDIDRPLTGVLNAAVCFGVRSFSLILTDRLLHLSNPELNIKEKSLKITLPELNGMFQTLIRKADLVFADKARGSGSLMRVGVKLSSMIEQMSSFLNEAADLEKLCVEDMIAVFEMTMLLYNSFLAKVLNFKDHQFGLNIGKHAMSLAKVEPLISREGLKLYQIIAEMILADARPEWMTQTTKVDEATLNQIEEGFKSILSTLILSDGVNPALVEHNILATRFLSRLCGFPRIRDIVVSKLDYDVIQKFTNSILESRTDTLSDLDAMNWSICIVEFLGVLAEFSNKREAIDLFMSLAAKPKVGEHIANCIRNGDERATNTALQIIGSVPFDRKNLPMITQNLITLKDGPSRSQHSSFMYPKSAANVGARNMSSMLDMVEESLTLESKVKMQGPDGSSDELKLQMSDLVSWYKIRMDVIQKEVKNMNEQVEYYKRRNEDLKDLLDKKTELFSKRAYVEEKGMLDIITLQRRLEKATKDYNNELTIRTQEIEHVKELYQESTEKVAHLEQDLIAAKTENERLVKLCEANTAAISDLKSKFSAAQDDKRSWRNDALRAKAELNDLKIKMEKVVKDALAKEVELTNTKSLLEKEKKTLDTIRSVIGNNFGNFNI